MLECSDVHCIVLESDSALLESIIFRTRTRAPRTPTQTRIRTWRTIGTLSHISDITSCSETVCLGNINSVDVIVSIFSTRYPTVSMSVFTVGYVGTVRESLKAFEVTGCTCN